MAEEQNQGQNVSENDSDSESRQERRQERRTPESEQDMVPRHRLNQEARAKRELEQRISKLEEEKAKEEEERAKKRGDLESLNAKYKNQGETYKKERDAARAELVRYKQLQTWREAARGIILDEAIDHAFEDLTSDDLNGIDETDTSAMTRLAEMLADSRSYLAAAPRGTGSGFGSRTPVLDRPSVARQAEGNGAPSIRKIIKKPKRRQWK